MIKSSSLVTCRALAEKKFGKFTQLVFTLVGENWTAEPISKDDPIFTRGCVLSFSPIKQPKTTSKKK